METSLPNVSSVLYYIIMDNKYNSPYRLLLITAISILAAEFLIMFFLSNFTNLTLSNAAIIDSFLLTIFIFPVLFFFAFQPLTANIKERLEIEKEREKLLSELQTTLKMVKILDGILPICSNCKKIRDKAGSWIQMESYIDHHSEAEFSHSVCPDCMKELYPEFKNKK